MTAPFTVRDLASVMGGWPFLRSSDGSSETQLISGVVDPQARIAGAAQEPAAGFAGLDTLSFLLYVDDDANSPFTVTFSDPGASGLTADDLATQINATTTPGPLPADVAFNENNFLILKSPTSGDGSYVKVASVAGSESLFAIIGLFSETEAYGGQLSQSPHVDPDRQVSLPGQASMMWGENFSANAFNRMAMQLAVNTDRSIGTLERKRIAVFKRNLRGVSDIQTGGGGKYFRLITTPGPTDEEWLYMGPHASGHAEFDPELAMSIVDADGNELTQDDENIIAGHTTPGDMAFTWAADEQAQVIVDNGGPAMFTSVTAEGDYYVKVTGLAAPADVLNGRLMKIVRKISSSTVEVQPLDADGNMVPISNTEKTGSMTMDAVQVVTKKVKVEGFYSDSALTARLEQVQESKVAAAAITALSLNNRVVAAGETFVTDGVVAGDIVTLTGHTNTIPHSNNGTYRVSKVIDEETLELVGSDWGPVYLNTQTAVGLGDIDVDSDGDFYDNPYCKFDDDDIVPAGDFYVLYQAMRSFKDAVAEDPAAFAAPTKYLQEAAHNTNKAILGIVGPSVDNLTDAINWLYSDRRNNMEDLYARTNKEHHDHDSAEGAGRHATIRPDIINMFPDVAGETVTIRADAGDASNEVKAGVRDSGDVLVMAVTASGQVVIGDTAAATLSTSYSLAVQESAKDAKVLISADADHSALDINASGAGKWSNLSLLSTHGDARAYLTAGDTGTSALMGFYQDSLASTWWLITKQGDEKFGFWYDAAYASLTNPFVVMDGNTGLVGIGTDSPDFGLTVQAPGATATEILMHLKAKAGTTTVQQRFSSEAGLVGYVYGGNVGGSNPVMGILSEEDITFETNADGRIALKPDNTDVLHAVKTATEQYVAVFGQLGIRTGGDLDFYLDIQGSKPGVFFDDDGLSTNIDRLQYDRVNDLFEFVVGDDDSFKFGVSGTFPVMWLTYGAGAADKRGLLYDKTAKTLDFYTVSGSPSFYAFDMDSTNVPHLWVGGVVADRMALTTPTTAKGRLEWHGDDSYTEFTDTTDLWSWYTDSVSILELSKTALVSQLSLKTASGATSLYRDDTAGGVGSLVLAGTGAAIIAGVEYAGSVTRLHRAAADYLELSATALLGVGAAILDLGATGTPWDITYSNEGEFAGGTSDIPGSVAGVARRNKYNACTLSATFEWDVGSSGDWSVVEGGWNIASVTGTSSSIVITLDVGIPQYSPIVASPMDSVAGGMTAMFVSKAAAGTSVGVDWTGSVTTGARIAVIGHGAIS